MEQRTIDDVVISIKVIGTIALAACLGFLVWSLFLPQVADGQMPRRPMEQQSR